MRQISIPLMFSLLISGCASQKIPIQPCGYFDGSTIHMLKRTVVPLVLESYDTAITYRPNSVTILFRLEDVMSVLTARVKEVGYRGAEQRMRGLLTTYPPRDGFSDLSQYAGSNGSYLAESIALELLESGKAIVADSRASGENLRELTIVDLERSTARGRAKWREVCSSAGDFVLYHLVGVQP